MDQLLVFADDHSDGASVAWEWVCAQSWSGWRVEVVTAVPSEIPGAEESSGMYEWEPAVRRVPHESTGVASVRHLRATGDARVVLGAVQADLLVIGPRGAGMGKKLHFGSVAEWLLDCPSAPTVIARHAAQVKRVTLAVDGSPHAHAAAELLGSLPWVSAAHIDVVAVEVGDGESTAGAEEVTALLAERCPDVSTEIIRPYDWDLTVNVRGDLMRFIREHPSDLLVMGTRGLQGWQRLRLGSTADYLAHHVDSSVLLMRCQDPA